MIAPAPMTSPIPIVTPRPTAPQAECLSATAARRSWAGSRRQRTTPKASSSARAEREHGLRAVVRATSR